MAAVSGYWDNREIVGLLLDDGVDVNIPGDKYDSARWEQQPIVGKRRLRNYFLRERGSQQPRRLI